MVDFVHTKWDYFVLCIFDRYGKLGGGFKYFYFHPENRGNDKI